MHSVPTFRYPSGHWQVKAPTELMHSWLGWQSCSCLSHSSMSAFVGVVTQTFKTPLLRANTPSCSMTDIYSVSVTCHWPLRSPHLHPAAENITLSHVLLCHAGHFLATSLKTQQLSSCEIVQIPALSARLPWTHAHSHPHRLHPHAASSPNTCCSHLSLTICGRQQCVYTTPHTHTNMLNNRSSCGHLSTSNPQTNKPDTHPHSCFPEARSLEGMGLRAQRV